MDYEDESDDYDFISQVRSKKRGSRRHDTIKKRDFEDESDDERKVKKSKIDDTYLSDEEYCSLSFPSNNYDIPPHLQSM